MYTWPGMDHPPARAVPARPTMRIKPEWVNSAEKWLKPLTTARVEEGRRAYGIGGHEAPGERIRQACVWALHLHRTHWESALDYTAAYDGLVAAVKARRTRALADRARTAQARVRVDPYAAPMVPLVPGVNLTVLTAAPMAPGPSSNPEDRPRPRQRGPMFSPPIEAAIPLPPDRTPSTPIEDAIRETLRGVPAGSRGGSHYQAGRFWTSKNAAMRALAGQSDLPRARIQRGIRRAANTVRAGRTDLGVTMGQLAALSAAFNGRRM